MILRRSLLVLPALLALLTLGACGSDDSAKSGDAKKAEDTKEPKPKKIEEPTPICPQTGAVRELSLIRDYGLDTPVPDNLIAGARMNGVTGDCSYHEDGIDMNFQIDMIAKRGPRLHGLHASFPIFVAVINPDGEIENKFQQKVDFGFSSDDDVANASQAMHVFIPLPKDQQKTGPYYRVLSGFQLTKMQEDDAVNAMMPTDKLPPSSKPSVPAPPPVVTPPVVSPPPIVDVKPAPPPLAKPASKMATKKQPKDVAAFLYREKMCHHWAGEEGYDAARIAEIDKATTKLQCDQLDDMEAALRTKYTASPGVLTALDAGKDDE